MTSNHHIRQILNDRDAGPDSFLEHDRRALEEEAAEEATIAAKDWLSQPFEIYDDIDREAARSR